MYRLLCKYLEACAAISITKDFKAYFRGTQTQCSNLDDDFVDLLYQCFLDRYQYEETVDPKDARKMNFRLEFVNAVADWDCIIESWIKEEWMKQSKVGAENRKNVLRDVEGEKTGKKASKVDEFERLHNRNKDSSDVTALDSPDCVGLDSPSSGIPFDSEAWEKAIGDLKKKNFYGRKITQDPEILHGHGTSSDSTPVNNEANIEAQVNARVESRLEDMREEIRVEMRQMFNDQQKAMYCNK
ncbi:hypothetical protein Tco_1221951 [Tanacetum coccineum]